MLCKLWRSIVISTAKSVCRKICSLYEDFKRVLRSIKGVNSHFGVALFNFLDSCCLSFGVLSKK